MLLRNAGRVSSFCNDVVGDICGIVSGTTAAVIVVRLQTLLDIHSVLLGAGVTAVISGLTIGGKALGKSLAINQSTRVVFLAGKLLHVFHRFSK
jgi:CBS domain containing-hemolysin-like protein